MDLFLPFVNSWFSYIEPTVHLDVNKNNILYSISLSLSLSSFLHFSLSLFSLNASHSSNLSFLCTFGCRLGRAFGLCLDGDWVGSWASSEIGEATTVRNCSNLGIGESLFSGLMLFVVFPIWVCDCF